MTFSERATGYMRDPAQKRCGPHRCPAPGLVWPVHRLLGGQLTCRNIVETRKNLYGTGLARITFNMDVTTHSSIEAFFHEVVTDALERAQVEATAAAEYYLVSLLGAFATTPITDEPLALKLARSQADPAARVRALKEVGDTSLYVTGFFGASLDRRGMVDASYYIGLGEAAYRELAGRLSMSAIGAIYWELAAKFPRLVDVLGEVRNQVDFTGGDVVKLYEQWRTTRSEWIERRLRALGVFVQRDDGGSGLLQ
jgi:hypothetical protein